MSQSVYQTNHDLLCEVLRRALRDAVESGPGGGMEPLQYRVCAMAYELLCDHPVDRRQMSVLPTPWCDIRTSAPQVPCLPRGELLPAPARSLPTPSSRP